MKLLTTSRVPQEIFDDLAKVCITDYRNSLESLSREGLRMRIQDAHALLYPLSGRTDQEVLDVGEDLELVTNYGVGSNNINTRYAAYKRTAVASTPVFSSTVSTAEMTFGLLLAVARGLIPGDELVRQGDFQGWRPTLFLSQQAKSRVLGAIDLGCIGSEVAKRALAFGIEAMYSSKTQGGDLEDPGSRYMDLARVLQQSDFITIHTSYQPQPHRLTSEDALGLIEESAILINASRGPIINKKALVQVLKDKRIVGAALDIYEFEPKVHPDLLTMDQMILSPHPGNITYAARMEVEENTRNSLSALVQGKGLPDRVS